MVERTRGQITCKVNNGKANIRSWTTNSNGMRMARVLGPSSAAAHSPVCTNMPQSKETRNTGKESKAWGSSLIRQVVTGRSRTSSQCVLALGTALPQGIAVFFLRAECIGMREFPHEAIVDEFGGYLLLDSGSVD